MNGKIIVASERKDYHRKRLDVVIIRSVGDRESMAAPLVFTDCTGMLIENPTIDGAYGQDFLQACLDHAWSIGMRPAGFTDFPLQIAALKDHLTDMRALVFQHPQLILAPARDLKLRGHDGA